MLPALLCKGIRSITPTYASLTAAYNDLEAKIQHPHITFPNVLEKSDKTSQ